MIEQAEITTLLLTLGCGVVFIIPELSKGAPSIKNAKIFAAAWLFYLFSQLFTVAEGFYLEDIMNTCEHAFIMLSSLTFMIWTFKLYKSDSQS